MGVEKGNAAVLTPVIADWEAALRIYNYDPEDWQRLVEEAQVLFLATTGQSKLKAIEPFTHDDLDTYIAKRFDFDAYEAYVKLWQN